MLYKAAKEGRLVGVLVNANRAFLVDDYGRNAEKNDEKQLFPWRRDNITFKIILKTIINEHASVDILNKQLQFIQVMFEQEAS